MFWVSTGVLEGNVLELNLMHKKDSYSSFLTHFLEDQKIFNDYWIYLKTILLKKYK